MLDAESIYIRSFNAGIKPDPDLMISEWANANRVLPEGAAKEHGPYRWERTPFWKEPMDCLSPSSPVNDVCIMKGVQIAGTTVGENVVLACVDMAIGPIMIVLPTVELAEDFSRDRLQPSIDATPCLTGKVADTKSKTSGNTILHKRYRGGSIKLVGANSAKAFRSRPIRILILDDIDGFDAQVGGEGDPDSLAVKRTTTYSNIRKIYRNSTPTEKGFSRIERVYDDSDQREYWVPCPHCKEKQVLKWGGKEASFGLKFTHLGPTVTEAWYECKHCHGRIDEGHKTWMLANGEWRPRKPENKHRRGYHLSSLYSPLGWKSWADIAQEFLTAGKNAQLLQVWTNTILAETWEEKGSKPDWQKLKNRSEPYPILEIPSKGMLVTASVDVQDDRLEPFIWAWGRGEEAWLIYAGAIFENPGQDRAWELLDEFLSKPVRHASGNEFHIPFTAIDSGGHHTQRVYNECRKRKNRWFAIKGSSNKTAPILGRPTYQDVNYKGESIKKGVQLWPIGTFIAKQLIYDRYVISEYGPGYIHTPIDMEDGIYKQLCSEKLVTSYSKGFPVKEWRLPSGERNEALDGLVYAYAAAIRAGVFRMNWDILEHDLCSVSSGINRPQSQQPEKRRIVHKSKMLGG